MTFSGWWIERDADGTGRTRFRNDIEADELPDGDVDLSVRYSGINYKDALALTGRPGVIRSWPMIPGIDAVGTVESSTSERFQPGALVVATGAGLGESRHGGLSEHARVDSASLVPVPDGISAEHAARLGTAGVTAMYSILELEREGLTPGDGQVLVTGASGGVGGIAIAALHARGWSVVASTGRVEANTDYLRSLGAETIIDRDELAAPGKPLQKQSWVAAVDTVGGPTLVNVLARTQDHGVVTACGLAQSADLPGSVLPFILRGVRLLGINSVTMPVELRERAWERLAADVPVRVRNLIGSTAPLAHADRIAEDLLAGSVRGRIAISVGAD